MSYVNYSKGKNDDRIGRPLDQIIEMYNADDDVETATQVASSGTFSSGKWHCRGVLGSTGKPPPTGLICLLSRNSNMESIKIL